MLPMLVVHDTHPSITYDLLHVTKFFVILSYSEGSSEFYGYGVTPLRGL